MSKRHKKKFRKMAAAQSSLPVAANRPLPSRSAEFNPDYSYVIKDLKRIGTLAAFFLTVLIILAFILR